MAVVLLSGSLVLGLGMGLTTIALKGSGTNIDNESKKFKDSRTADDAVSKVSQLAKASERKYRTFLGGAFNTLLAVKKSLPAMSKEDAERLKENISQAAEALQARHEEEAMITSLTSSGDYTAERRMDPQIQAVVNELKKTESTSDTNESNISQLNMKQNKILDETTPKVDPKESIKQQNVKQMQAQSERNVTRESARTMLKGGASQEDTNRLTQVKELNDKQRKLEKRIQVFEAQVNPQLRNETRNELAIEVKRLREEVRSVMHQRRSVISQLPQPLLQPQPLQPLPPQELRVTVSTEDARESQRKAEETIQLKQTALEQAQTELAQAKEAQQQQQTALEQAIKAQKEQEKALEEAKQQTSKATAEMDTRIHQAEEARQNAVKARQNADAQSTARVNAETRAAEAEAQKLASEAKAAQITAQAATAEEAQKARALADAEATRKESEEKMAKLQAELQQQRAEAAAQQQRAALAAQSAASAAEQKTQAEAELQQQRAEAAQLQAQSAALQQQQRAEAALQQQRAEAAQLQAQSAALATQAAAALEALEALEAEKAQLQAQSAASAAQSAALEAEKAQLQVLFETEKKKSAELEESKQIWERTEANTRKARNAEGELVKRMQTELDAVKQQQANQQKNTQKLIRNERAQLQEEKQKYIEKAEQDVTAQEAEILELRERLREAQQLQLKHAEDKGVAEAAATEAEAREAAATEAAATKAAAREAAEQAAATKAEIKQYEAEIKQYEDYKAAAEQAAAGATERVATARKELEETKTKIEELQKDKADQWSVQLRSLEKIDRLFDSGTQRFKSPVLQQIRQGIGPASWKQAEVTLLLQELAHQVVASETALHEIKQARSLNEFGLLKQQWLSSKEGKERFISPQRKDRLSGGPSGGPSGSPSGSPMPTRPLSGLARKRRASPSRTPSNSGEDTGENTNTGANTGVRLETLRRPSRKMSRPEAGP